MSTVQQLYDSLSIKKILTVDGDIFAAVNFAIDEGAKHGFVLSERIDNAGTFVANTYVYTMPTALDRWFGVGEVLVNEADNRLEVRHRGLCQHFDQSAGAWILEFPESIVNRHVGRTFDILYFTPYPHVDAMTDTVSLPDGYVKRRIAEWAAEWKMADQGTDDGQWANILINNQRRGDNFFTPPPPRVPEVRRKDRPA